MGDNQHEKMGESTYSFLELCTLIRCECICLGDDGDNVHLQQQSGSQGERKTFQETKLTFS